MVYEEADRGEGIKTKLDQVLELLGSKELKKAKGTGFRLPFSIAVRAKMIAKTNRALVFYLRTNRNMEIKIAPIINGMVTVEDKYYDARADCFYMYKGIPVLMIPEWSLIPIGTADYYKAIKDKEMANAQQIILRAIETKEMGMATKFKFNMRNLIIIGIVVIVLFFVFGEYMA